MSKFLSYIKKTFFRKTNFKAFSFFFILSFAIWALIQLSKSYEQTLEIGVIYTNIPKDKIIKKERDAFFLKAQDNGFGIIWHKITKPKVKVRLDSLAIRGDKLVYDVRSDESYMENMAIAKKDITYLTDTLSIPFFQKTKKKIPIVPKISVSYAPGFSSQGTVRIKPDSVMVSGMPKSIKKIEQIETEKLVLNNLDRDTKGKVSLNTKDFEDITFYKSNVSYLVEVEKFTEGSLEIPIKVINAPTNINVSIFPKNVVVRYVVSLENYSKISEKDFEVVCDYSGVESDQSFLIPQIKKKPDFVTSTRLNINKVQFVIIK